MVETTTSRSSPDYGNPPVVETILGVQFERMAEFRNAHMGAFWKALDSTAWPRVSDAPLLPVQFEPCTKEARWSKGVQVHVSQDPSSRLQITNAAGDRMIQLQNTRFHFNWLGQAGMPYPRYETVRVEFSDVYGRFLEFVRGEGLGELRPNQWEVTYLNHIPKGTVWREPNDWGFFQLLRGVPTIAGLIQGESFGGNWTFCIPEERGRLHIQWQHGARSEPDEQELIVLTLTARGPLDGTKPDIASVLGGLDLGHLTIVQSFERLMSTNANDYWELKNVNR